ncbi:TolC family protein [Zoogloea dura]|uniref:TolC family protein n=1 Tax=Zoogloea dura TaxID=2728840 RepID=A0A848GCB3_9RHOO|nr:TolC family protein [Zoogloea dura]NML28772.1 TolC family protein [Zoogloea dura]
MKTPCPAHRPILALVLALAAMATQAAPLPTVVDKVLLLQPGVRSAQALLRAAEAQITQARSDFAPTLGLSYRNTDSRDETQGNPVDRRLRRNDASLRWNIFNGAADTHRLRSAAFGRDAAEADLDNVLEQLTYEITEAYTDVVRLRQTMDSLRATLERQEQVAANVARRVEAGRIPSAELDLIHVRQIQNQALLGQLRAQLGTAEYRYRLLAGEAPEALVTPSLRTDAKAGDLDALVERIRERSPRLRAALQRSAARQADIGVARGSFFPSVDLSFSKRLDNHSNPVPVTDTDRSTQLQVSIDIPLGGKNLGRHTEAVARHQAAQADADKLLLKVSRELTDLHHQYLEASGIAPRLEQRVMAAQRVAAAYALHFEAGRRSLNDLSIAQDELFSGQRALIENRAQQITLQAQLLSLAGELREALRTRYQAAPITPELLGTEPYSPAFAAAPLPVIEAPPAPRMDLDEAATSPTATAGLPPARQIQAWATAWSAGDYTAYRSFYAEDFRPGRGRSLAGWEEERRRRLAEARSPQILIEDVQVRSTGAERVSLRFVQRYSAGHYQDVVRKQLDWARQDGRWKIVAETVLAAPAKATAEVTPEP